MLDLEEEEWLGSRKLEETCSGCAGVRILEDDSAGVFGFRATRLALGKVGTSSSAEKHADS